VQKEINKGRNLTWFVLPSASTVSSVSWGSSMKHLAITSCLLSALVLLCGCGGGGTTSSPPSNSPNLQTPSPTAQGVNIAGNWQINTTSTSGMTPLSIGGSINQSGSSVTGVVHVNGSNCFNQLTTVGLTGTLTGSNISLTSTSVGGVVIAFTGSIINNAFTGTYTLSGACTDQGNVTGMRIPFIANILSGTFTPSGGETFGMVAHVAQDSSASSEGSFGITGTVTFSTSCFSSGTITSGTFPSRSFIIGTSVALEIETGNGTVAFLGTANPATGQISGNYTVSGGTCDQTGTAVLVASNPWDY
jgi:hypothetical protein